MRVRNSIKNMIFGLFGQIVSIGMGFLVRTVFIYTLGIQYLGVNGLFSSVLMMLSLANLGFDTAMVYSLYKPLAERDTRKIQAFMNLFRKAYKIVAAVVLLLGLSLMPFLEQLIHGESGIEQLHLIYVMFLVQSVASYFFVYKQSIIVADQRYHVISKIHTVFVLISNGIQVLLLVIVGNYIAVLAGQLAFRIFENIYIARKANALYPFIVENNEAKLSREERKRFFTNMYSLLLYKISGVVINGTDNIIISKFIGLAAVGIYSNYLLILSTLQTFLGYIFYSVTASVGNLHVTESKEKKYFVFRVLQFMNFWIYGCCAIALWILIDPFIALWLGESYMFGGIVTVAVVLNFLTTGMQNASTTFRDTTGLFAKGKYRPIIAAAINVGLSLILVRSLGVAGVLFGTVISRFCTFFWYDPYVVFKYVFEVPVRNYFKTYAWHLFLIGGAGAGADTLAGLLHIATPAAFVYAAFVAVLVPNVIFYFVFRKTEEFRYVQQIVGSMLDGLVGKMGKRKSLNATGGRH